MTTWSSATWETESFVSGLRAFVADAIGEPDRVECVRRRPWSAAWRVTAGGVRAYAKQNCPGQAHEAGLLALLNVRAPEHVVPVLAADPARDLLLTPDLGQTMQEAGRGGEVGLWCRIAADSTALQREASVLDLGLTVLCPAESTTYVADAVGRLAALPTTDPRRLETALAHRLERLLPTIDGWIEQVEALGLPTTLVHNDLHADNVLELDGALRFFDFGDAVETQPLANLLVPLGQAAEDLAVGPSDPALALIADAALEVWSDLASVTELRAALPAALQLGRLARVESWRRCVATMTTTEQVEYGGAPAGWLASLLDPAPLATSTEAGPGRGGAGRT